MILDGEGAGVKYHSLRRNQAETGVGGADVSDEPSLGVGLARVYNRMPRAESVRQIRVSVSQASIVRRTLSGCRVYLKLLISPRILSIANAFAKSILTSWRNALDCAVR